MKNYLITLLFLFSTNLFAQLSNEQLHTIDSLKKVISSDAHDTSKIVAYFLWDDLIYIVDPDLDLQINTTVLDLCKKNLKQKNNPTLEKFYKQKLSFANNNLGIIFMYQSKYEKAIEHYNECLRLSEEIGEKQKIAAAFNNLGVLYYRQGNLKLAIDYYLKGLKKLEEVDNKDGVAGALNNIGNIYKEIGDLDEARSYYQKSLAISEKIGNKNWAGVSYNSLGEIYLKEGDYETTLEYCKKSIELNEAIGNLQGKASAIANIGSVYLQQGNVEKAIEQFKLSIEMMRSAGDQRGEALSLDNLGKAYFQKGNFSEAIKYSLQSLKLSQSIGKLMESSLAAKSLYDAYKKTNNYKSALEMYELYISLRDSVRNEENTRTIIQKQFQYDYDKKTLSDSIKNLEADKVRRAESAKEKAESANQRQQKMYLFIGLGIAILFGIFIYNRFEVTKKQKIIIEEQKSKVSLAYDELEEKNKEILDSITYAKRIQGAILPSKKIVKEHLQESFILYKPKDIVAGDFYWMESFDKSSDANNIILFAACDCTGHGVPGAMVSVVCHNALNRSVREYGLRIPGEILDKTRSIVIQEFEKSDEEVKDGMDISLCALNLKESILYWAGANNPLWIIRNSELIEYKPDKQPIGKYADAKPFATQKIQLQKNDCLYIFTDGYADQFGGEQGKKYKAAKMKSLLLSIHTQPMEAQSVIINANFEQWKGNLEQVDDICMIGVKIC